MVIGSGRNFDVGFFSDLTTTEAIVDLASATRLTIFVGAGVSADQNIPKWSDLVRDLMLRRIGKAEDSTNLVDDILANYLELPSASIVDRLYEEKWPRHGTRHRNSDIRSAIYGTPAQPRKVNTSPSLIKEILLVAAAMKTLGRDVHIVTTNYDCLFEELRQTDEEVKQVFTHYNVELLPLAVEPPLEVEPSAIPLVYIHGRIPRKGPYSDLVVFSEPDYVAWMQRSDLRDYLSRRFDHGYTLVLGASLRDYNIITYLKRTHSPEAVRYALMPVQGDTAYAMKSSEQYSKLTKMQDLRGRALGIALLHPDFFGQVFQFVHELALAVTNNASGDSYADIAYMRRVETWWAAFESRKYASDRVRQAGTRKLQAASQELRTFVPEANHIKLEVWIRAHFSVTDDPRALEMWCSSQSMWLSKGTHWPHTAALTLNSTLPAIVCFANRGFVYGAVTGRSDKRWTHYAALPIVLESKPYLSVPVGSVVALFNSSHVNSGALPSVVANSSQIAEKLKVTGESLLFL
jgi:hypothetical protein